MRPTYVADARHDMSSMHVQMFMGWRIQAVSDCETPMKGVLESPGHQRLYSVISANLHVM